MNLIPKLALSNVCETGGKEQANSDFTAREAAVPEDCRHYKLRNLFH